MISLEHIFKKYPFRKRNISPEAEIAAIENEFNIKFPHDYKYYLLHYEGYEDFIGKEYVELWSVDELKKSNDGCCIQKWVPSFFGIGSNMGGELIALERTSSDHF